MAIEWVAAHVVDVAVRLHMRLGPGLFESVYEVLMEKELLKRGFAVERQKPVEFEFDGVRFERGLVVDLLVDRGVVIELKSVERIAPVHSKQVLTYLRLMDLQLGFVLNFGASTMKEGLHRVINTYRPTYPLHPSRLRVK